MKHLPLHLGDDLAGVALVPVPVEVLGHGAELDDQVVGEVFGLDLAALLPPKPVQGILIVAHDDPSIRAADEPCAIERIFGANTHHVASPVMSFLDTNGFYHGFND